MIPIAFPTPPHALNFKNWGEAYWSDLEFHIQLRVNLSLNAFCFQSWPFSYNLSLDSVFQTEPGFSGFVFLLPVPARALCKLPSEARHEDSSERCLDHPAGGPFAVGLTDLGSSHSLWWEQFSLLLSGDAWGVFYELNHASGSSSLPFCSLEGCQSSTAQGSCKAKSSEPSGRCSGILFSLKCRA